MKQPSATFHSQLDFELEVTMFWGVHGVCTLSAFAWRMRGCCDSSTTYAVVGYSIASVYPVWTNAMNEFVISKAGV
jgi:hypothetical protein